MTSHRHPFPTHVFDNPTYASLCLYVRYSHQLWTFGLIYTSKISNELLPVPVSSVTTAFPSIGIGRLPGLSSSDCFGTKKILHCCFFCFPTPDAMCYRTDPKLRIRILIVCFIWKAALYLFVTAVCCTTSCLIPISFLLSSILCPSTS